MESALGQFSENAYQWKKVLTFFMFFASKTVKLITHMCLKYKFDDKIIF